MLIFRKKQANTMPVQAMKYRQETHQAAKQASDGMAKLNLIMSNGITVKIYHSTRKKK